MLAKSDETGPAQRCLVGDHRVERGNTTQLIGFRDLRGGLVGGEHHPRTVLSEERGDLGRCGLLGRGELAQIVDAEAFFDIGDFVDHPLEAGLAEAPMLLVFKSLRHVAKLHSGHHVA